MDAIASIPTSKNNSLARVEMWPNRRESRRTGREFYDSPFFSLDSLGFSGAFFPSTFFLAAATTSAGTNFKAVPLMQ